MNIAALARSFGLKITDADMLALEQFLKEAPTLAQTVFQHVDQMRQQIGSIEKMVRDVHRTTVGISPGIEAQLQQQLDLYGGPTEDDYHRMMNGANSNVESSDDRGGRDDAGNGSERVNGSPGSAGNPVN